MRLHNQEAEAQSSGRRRRALHPQAVPGGFIVPLGDGDGRFYASAFLQVKGLSGFDLTSVFRRFADFDLDRVDGMIEDLRDESRLASALTAICELRLKRAFAEEEEE
ncbi:MAG: hypothetical protein GY953_30335 [bacterium]|nr:hypothetical protein [bacterium]